MNEKLAYYVEPGPITQLDEERALADVPEDVAGICAPVDGVILHIAWAGQLGVTVPKHHDGTQIRSCSAILQKILELDPEPIGVARPPGRRMVGCCRHASVFTCALLRRADRPYRVFDETTKPAPRR